MWRSKHEVLHGYIAPCVKPPIGSSCWLTEAGKTNRYRPGFCIAICRSPSLPGFASCGFAGTLVISFIVTAQHQLYTAPFRDSAFRVGVSLFWVWVGTLLLLRFPVQPLCYSHRFHAGGCLSQTATTKDTHAGREWASTMRNLKSSTMPNPTCASSSS